MKDSDFVSDYGDFLNYKYHKINLNCDRSYIDSPE